MEILFKDSFVAIHESIAVLLENRQQNLQEYLFSADAIEVLRSMNSRLDSIQDLTAGSELGREYRAFLASYGTLRAGSVRDSVDDLKEMEAAFSALHDLLEAEGDSLISPVTEIVWDIRDRIFKIEQLGPMTESERGVTRGEALAMFIDGGGAVSPMSVPLPA